MMISTDIQLTPPAIRQSIYNKAIIDLRRTVGIEYVAWMEDTAARVFDQFTALDTTIFPETFGPRDEDPLIRFGEWLNAYSQNNLYVHDHFETPKQSVEADRRMKDRLRQDVINRHKGARAMGPAERIILSAVEQPFPSYLHQQDVLMTVRTMRETPSFDQGGKVGPKEYADLGEEGDLRILTKLKNPLPKANNIEEADALHLHLDFAKKDLKKAADMVKTMKCKLQEPLRGADGMSSLSAIWDKWEKESKAKLQQLPEPLSPKLFPRCLTKEPGHSQLNTFKDIEQLVAPTAANGLKLSIPRDVMTQCSSREWVMEDNNDFVEEVFRLKNLDDFDGVPFAPLTPNSVVKYSRIPASVSQGYNHLPMSPPPTVERKSKMPWDQDPRLEIPVMPARISSPYMNPDSVNRLFTAVENPFPPARIHSFEGGSAAATPSCSFKDDGDVNMPSEARVFCDLLVDGDTQARVNRNGNYGRAEEEAMAYAMEEQLDTSKTSHMPVLNMKYEAYGDPSNDLPKTFCELLEGSKNQGLEADKQMFIKYPGLNTALASELSWIPFSTVSDAALIEDGAKASPMPKNPPQSLTVPSTDILARTTPHPSETILRKMVERSPKSMTPARPRWMTIQDMDKLEGSAGDVGWDESFQAPSPALTATRRKKRKEVSQKDPEEVDELFEEGPDLPQKPTAANNNPEKAMRINLRKKTRSKDVLQSNPQKTSLDDITDIITSREVTHVRALTKNIQETSLTMPDDASNMKNDLSTIRGFLYLQKLDHLIIEEQEPTYKLPPDQSLSPIFEEEEPMDWRLDPILTNPEWFIQISALQPQSFETPMPIMATVSLFQNRPLIRMLESRGLYLLDNFPSLQGADLVISPTTALVFRPLSSLPDIHVELLEELKLAATYYQRVILVFETISYAASERYTKTSNNFNPLATAVVHALGSLSRGKKAAWGTRNIIGELDIVFAYKGAGEISNSVSKILREDEERLRENMGEEGYLQYQGREWIGHEPIVEHENTMVEMFGINTFGARYALATYGGAERLAYEMTEDERMEQLGPIWGQISTARFNDTLRELLGAEVVDL
ncbi:hypothetical protein I314_00985 [Cryptococcus bacillisporus CA1873]|uniref:Uncharacterized protein n=1 Tax=Cryptococcus bacillisporus CA1873 TaxID=1296111 RepID=A0ABR5BHF1_CRYGA|nr:hypothetical protein I314_00985 [Cryptococcus bacillisporus CA1873]|eukprot:KIR68564.1 hypothetical protein I314_00985 [Cryptococcus gattii CA1873]